MAETREERIAEFHEENSPTVVGLREGAWLAVSGETVALGGSTGARLFRRGQSPIEYPSGSRLDFLLQAAKGVGPTNE
jgi:dipeptidase E